ncbi:myotubularin-related protein 4 isoform X2 [Bombina bombina]|uniref:myotubularin-related protein 4 isoform X2 n=1 Tax=Bombina bombina TaxID=8345 RepID=UPI00235B098D|nr:myotubularin-related protein 4 isoform X2 [Bombina bombina]
MGEEPPSLEYIQAKDLFPPRELVKEEDKLQVPFQVLPGEGVEYLGSANDAVIAISNYRLHIKFKDSVINVPLRMIETVESRDMFQLQIICKDSKVVRCHFSTFKQCQEWLKRLSRATIRPTKQEDLFAFAYHAWCQGICSDEEEHHVHLCRPGDHVKFRFQRELERMGFDLQNAWRVSDINNSYKLCSSYPQKLLVPVWITDKELENVASFRSWKRIPVVVYRHTRTGAVIARCSQPEISWWGWRNADDEYLVTSIAKACVLNPGSKVTSGNLKGSSDGGENTDTDFDSSLTVCPGIEVGGAPQKLLILDARSYTAAVANRAKGGGCECEEYYPNCEVVFMGMANIHSIRNSFQYLRAVCNQVPDPGNWLSALESTKWLQHLSAMLKAATVVANAVDREGRPVLVHCSDGWDRTPQIVSLAKILLDPYYRTLEGFQVLVETDWLDYGHKFGDRCGHQENAEDQSEQCPVFLQWLDCVHQLLHQFPCLFEFNHAFLVKLVQHTYSCLYGTFLANNSSEREIRNIYKWTCSVWSLLRTGNKNFHNLLYMPGSELVLHPVCHVRALQLWTAVYLPASSPCTPIDNGMELYLSPASQGPDFSSRSLDRMPKTRSMDNLVTACDSGGLLTRTSSDPNLNKHQGSMESRNGSVEGSEAGSQETQQHSTTLDSSKEEETDNDPVKSSSNEENTSETIEENKLMVSELMVSENAKENKGFDFETSKGNEGIVSKTTNHNNRELNLLNSTSLTKVDHVDWKCSSFKPGVESNPDIQVLSDTTVTNSNTDSHKSTALVHLPNSLLEADLAVHTISCIEVSKAVKSPLELRTDKKNGFQAPKNDFSFLSSNWDGLQGMMKSVPIGELGLRHQMSYDCSTRSLHSRHGRHATGLCFSRESAKLSCNYPTSLHCSGSSVRNRCYVACHTKHHNGRFLPLTCPSPASVIYHDDDGLPIPNDVVQQRLRQMEASYKQEVELLRRQVWELQIQLEIRQHCAPPSEPEADYEDDFTCVKESDGSDMDDLYSDKSEDRLSEASWEPVDKKETEVTRWVPDHMASHCFNCDCEFWLAKRRHHCRNCGNVFCASCCHLKLPIPDQQLYDPVLVCNTCYDHIQVARARELMSQQLKKPLAAASS